MAFHAGDTARNKPHPSLQVHGQTVMPEHLDTVLYCLVPGRIRATPERGVSQRSERAETTQTMRQSSTNGMPQPPFVLRTPLAKRLWELRQEIVASGVPLLSLDEVRKEIQERRGGVVEEAS